MPIFDYKCNSCGYEERDVLVCGYNDDKKNKCLKCMEGNMEKIFPDKFNFKLKGKWFKTGGY